MDYISQTRSDGVICKAFLSLPLTRSGRRWFESLQQNLHPFWPLVRVFPETQALLDLLYCYEWTQAKWCEFFVVAYVLLILPQDTSL